MLDLNSEKELVRAVEALLFAASEPLSQAELAERLTIPSKQLKKVLLELQIFYEERGVQLVRMEDHWAFRTADDLSHLMQKNVTEMRRLSRAAMETLAIIAFHQPVTRTEIEDIRGVSTSKGTLDLLLQTGWVKLKGRRKVPGRPVTYGTTLEFLDHFGLESIDDLPGVEEMKGAGLLDHGISTGSRVSFGLDYGALHVNEEEGAL
ncbi:SMC-Scp complex subunit ScpB [Flexibacterium corallicola]|uniref:SMC-Scp complex subunit ScpB n=1 Tax=Flexibacterium corallicola TaxID=3037259 RepID=UPI00286EE6EB|nr:SMC-Scp complex subunit ScpB [Pseudovibrio sp. M1P-2-3]